MYISACGGGEHRHRQGKPAINERAGQPIFGNIATNHEVADLQVLL